MSNNTSSSPSTNFPVLCSLDDGNTVYDVYVCEVFFVSSVIIATFSPVAVAGNALILAAIWKKTFQRTPFHVLLSGLAFTDLCTGLIVQPVTAASILLLLTNPTVVIARPMLIIIISTIGNVSCVYFVIVTLLIITLMAVERWLHMSRRSLVTSRRGCFTVTLLLLIPIPLVVLRVVDTIKGNEGRELVGAFFAVMLFCFLTTSVAYLNVFRIVRQHQQRVEGNESSQNFGQPAINLAKYRKSVVSILYILALISFCFLPMIVTLLMHLFVGNTSKMMAAFNLSMVPLFLSSSLNPGLYLWRMNDVRHGMKQLFCSNC